MPVNSHIVSYQVHIAPGASERFGESLGDAMRVAVIVPRPLRALAERVGKHCPGQRVTTIIVPGVEAAKTPAALERCRDELAMAGFTRSDLVVGLGGGTTTDLVGSVVASWLRGVDFISIPTTVLGMVDAAVGGKTGINLVMGKNLVGAFHESRVVTCDLDLLWELPGTEVVPGLVEVVKCDFILDAGILQLADSDPGGAPDVTSDILAESVGRAAVVKVGVVAEDLTERTSSDGSIGREVLNYGHTMGHVTEAYEGFRLRHGQAISTGMVWIVEVNRRLLGLDAALAADHSRLLGALGLPVTHDPETQHGLRRLMGLDKKPRGDGLRSVGLAAQGRPATLESPDESELAEPHAVVFGRGQGSGKIPRRPVQVESERQQAWHPPTISRTEWCST